MPSNRTNRFEKHPVITIGIVILLGTLTTAIVFLAICRFYPWRVEEKDFYDAAFTYREASPVFHHSLSKNRAVMAAWGPLRYRLYTNSLGFRDRYVRDVPLNVENHRILLMGDSFTEGIGLPYDDTFAGIIARTLKVENVDVLNAGVVSYSPIIYWRKTKYLIETVGLQFDEMVVFLDISDARDEAESYYLDDQGNVQSHLFKDPKIRRKILNRIRRDGVVDSLSRYLSILTDFSTRPAWETGRWTIDPDLLEKYGRPGLAQMTIYMNRLRELLKRHGIQLTVAVYPWPAQIREKNLDSIQAVYWRDWCRRYHIDFIDYFPVFIDPEGKDPQKVIDQYFIPGDAHWNRQGHERIADVFCRHFRQRHGGE